MINSSILSIIVCFIPAIIIGLILYYFDSDKSKKKLLLLALSFVVGAFMFYIAYRLDMHFGTYFKGFIATSYFKSFLYALFGVAIFEESCKFIGTLVFIFKYKIKNIYNSIVLSSFVALGFSMAESIFFYLPKFLDKGNAFILMLNRTMTTTPTHVSFGIVMGYFLGKFILSKKIWKKIIYIIFALVIPMVLHALANFALYRGGLFNQVVTQAYLNCLFLFVICLCYIIIRKIGSDKDERV